MVICAEFIFLLASVGSYVAEASLVIALSRLIWGLDFQPVVILNTRSTSFHSEDSTWTRTGVERPISDEMTPSSMSVNSPVLSPPNSNLCPDCICMDLRGVKEAGRLNRALLRSNGFPL